MKIVTLEALEELSRQAAGSPRRRANLNLHPELSDPVQRFFNALEPGSYVRPHRHGTGRWETFIALAGRAVMLTFDDDGTVLERADLAPAGPAVAAEVAGDVWHAVAALEPGTVLLELKPGPYHPIEDKDFAPWAPPEGDAAASLLVRWYTTARPGSSPPPLRR
jgi:cupin fold WbuC family metalloprotein